MIRSLPLPFAWRAHHILLCASSYIGQGYTPAFTANLNNMLDRINAAPKGLPVKLVDGPDDWCRPLLAASDPASLHHGRHCRQQGTIERDRIAREDLGRLLGRSIQPGDIVIFTPALIRQFRQSFQDATLARRQNGGDYPSPRRGCHACSWHTLCDEVARNDYQNTRLYPEKTSAPQPFATFAAAPKPP